MEITPQDCEDADRHRLITPTKIAKICGVIQFQAINKVIKEFLKRQCEAGNKSVIFADSVHGQTYGHLY